MSSIPFAIVGRGWRAEFYLRIAQALPERFEVSGMVVRSAEAAREIETLWNVPAFQSTEALLKAAAPRFVVTSVPWAANPGVVMELVERGVPVLSETPPAPDLDGMRKLYEDVRRRNGNVQVAEQVHLRPHHQAQLALAHSGKLGTVSQAQVSVAHGYHGISVMRKFLGIRFEDATVRASRFVSPLVQGAGRKGLPAEEKIVPSTQELWQFDFGERLGVLDFTGSQYFATIRNERLLVRGERGEIVNHTVYYLKDFRSPVRLELQRVDLGAEGNLELHHLRGYRCGEDFVYANPYAPVALMDDEIAIAHALEKMDACVRGGAPFYPLAEGCQDHYLNLLAQEAVKADRPVKSEKQCWSE